MVMGPRDFAVPLNVQTNSEAHLASYSLGTRVLSWGKSAGTKFITHPRLVPSLRMGGAVPLLPPCACMAWTGTTLPVYRNFKQTNYRS